MDFNLTAKDLLDHIETISTGVGLPTSLVASVITAYSHYSHIRFKLIPAKSGSLVLCLGKDYITKNPIYYLLFDMQVGCDYLNSRLATPFVLSPEMGMKYVYLDREGFDLQGWIESIKSKKSCFIGSRYNEITWEITTPSNLDLLRLEDLKQLNYPDFDIQLSLASEELANNVDLQTVEMHTGYKGGEVVCIFLTMVGNTDGVSKLCVPYAWSTEDEAIRKRHSPMLLAHVQAVKHWFTSDIQVIDFGAYFKYKEILNFKTYVKLGLDQKQFEV